MDKEIAEEIANFPFGRSNAYSMVFGIAIHRMSVAIAEAEKKGWAEGLQMNSIVLPILNEVQEKLKKIKANEDPKLKDWPA